MMPCRSMFTAQRVKLKQRHRRRSKAASRKLAVVPSPRDVGHFADMIPEAWVPPCCTACIPDGVPVAGTQQMKEMTETHAILARVFTDETHPCASQLLLLPLLAGQSVWSLMLSNTLYAVAFSVYFYVTHLGYRCEYRPERLDTLTPSVFLPSEWMILRFLVCCC